MKRCDDIFKIDFPTAGCINIVCQLEKNEYIKERFGSVNTPENWGAVGAPKRKLKLWWNSQNTD